VGQDNEALRNLLIDTDRRINAIDDAKNAFRRLSEPISTALRDLAQEKIDNAGLRNALAELRTSYAVLRGEFGALEQRAAELEGDRDSLRRELARVQQDARGLESDKAELISEIAAARAQLEQMEANLAAAEVERAALFAARDEASSEAHTLNGRIEAIRSRAATAEKLLQIEIEVGAYRAQAERRIEELNAALDRERFEFAVAQEKSRQAYAQLQGNGPTEPPAQQERTDSDEVFKPAELKVPIASTSETIHNSKVLKAKLAKIAEEVLNTAAPALDRSGSAEPHGASESRRPTR
jgi:chromosome segregation ATPase